MTSVKRERFRFADALKVAADMQKLLGQYCSRIQIVGSLRRELPTVKDVEILFIPTIKPVADDLFGNSKPIDVTAEILNQLLEDHLIEKAVRDEKAELAKKLTKLEGQIADKMAEYGITKYHFSDQEVVFKAGKNHIKIKTVKAEGVESGAEPE